MLQQLGVLISIVKQHIRSYLDEIFGLIKVSFRYFERRREAQKNPAFPEEKKERKVNYMDLIGHRAMRILGAELFDPSIHEYLGYFVVTDSKMCPCFFSIRNTGS